MRSHFTGPLIVGPTLGGPKRNSGQTVLAALFDVTFETTGSTLAGYIPAGAAVLSVRTLVGTAFDSLTTDVVDVGTVGTGDAYASDLDLQASAAAAASAPVLVADDGAVYVEVTSAGGGLSEGAAVVIIEYVVDPTSASVSQN